jgi:hypothetical protein
MDRKNQKRNERPNDVEEEHVDKGGLKSETKTQGLKPDTSTLPETEPDDEATEDSDEV